LSIIANLSVQIRFLSFYGLRLSSCKLTGLHAVRDPVQLIFTAD
jgi:hypothetical protein